MLALLRSTVSQTYTRARNLLGHCSCSTENKKRRIRTQLRCACLLSLSLSLSVANLQVTSRMLGVGELLGKKAIEGDLISSTRVACYPGITANRLSSVCDKTAMEPSLHLRVAIFRKISFHSQHNILGMHQAA